MPAESKRESDAAARTCLKEIDLRGDLALISAPTLIVHGTRDRIAPRAFAAELRDGLPHARLEWFDGGHSFPLGPTGAHWLAETTFERWTRRHDPDRVTSGTGWSGPALDAGLL